MLDEILKVVGVSLSPACFREARKPPQVLTTLLFLCSRFRIDDYAIRGKEPADEIQIYTWKDATLRELSDLIKDVNEDARRPSARLSFSIVYPDERGRNVLRSIGNVCSH